MPKWWLGVGPPKYWQIAFEHGCIWGLKGTFRHSTLWRSLSPGDYILFYATSPVSGIIGYGVVRTKFRQDKPLWPQEVKQNKTIWPYRFEFDVRYVLPQDKWKTHKFISESLSAFTKGGFQAIPENLATELVDTFPSADVGQAEKKPFSLHEEIKANLIEVGRLQKMVAQAEYDMDIGRLDVVWRRVERAVPTYVFEIQIGGDLHYAIGKLKHAFDLWNSNIFLVISREDLDKAMELLTGMFHEIRDKIKIIEAEKINELTRRKKAYHEFESELGIL